jgi:hypothetical protein
MATLSDSLLSLGLAFTCAAALSACSLDVDRGQSDRGTDVDVRTPAGQLSVRTDVDTRDTGLRIYPGARVVSSGDTSETANVDINTAWFGVKVIAGKYQTDAATAQVVDFYRSDLRRYGAIVECRGNLDFEGPSGRKKPVCREDLSSRELQMVAGTEDRHRIVVVKPSGNGSEFAVVYVETRGDR